MFLAENCIPLKADALAQRVEWKNNENFIDHFPVGWNENVAASSSKRPFSKCAIALKFYLNNAKLYSFWFADEKLPLEQGRIVPVAPLIP